jgi:tetratricopeptide (TPR) repeat protein
MRCIPTAFAIVVLSASSSFGQDDPFGSQDFQPPAELEYFDESSEDLEIPPAPPPAPPTSEELLAELALVENEEDAEDIERRLQNLWSRSGSATADLLFSRSDDALEANDFETAEQLLAELTELAPDFAEGWHRHAIIKLRQENFEEAMTSLRHTLSLQPKHFFAMAELGSILEEFGDTENALAAYREAIALNPFIDGLGARVRELTRNVEGQGI